MKVSHTLKYLFILLLAFSCKSTEVTPDKTDHLALGNPSNAITDSSQPENYLLAKPQYVVSYSKSRGIPNWVSWHVNSTWLGQTDRQDNFRADATLPAGWYKVNASSYTGTGFDRGHCTPSADRTSSSEDNAATFLMTNMLPQAPNHNRETWANLEEYTRKLVQQGMEIYVIMGAYGAGGTGENGYRKTIDEGRVTVPARIWKVLVVLPEGNNDLNRINSSTRVIAVDSPNLNSVSGDWAKYRTTVDAIEQATGYDLLSALPTKLQQDLESRLDNGPVR
ncbi:DNA/RNA non-specific endonuclease [Pontibacter arcticus]|uniref:DNA/RNA non-specific endonuclease n=1 Tax=Pontibacter arcticus TaxID=2080288 RepID=A0A364RCC2_9BACT|nr:DNA/RNA non-specific endonuclease [Pontibacter arcticus]RAU81806.1 DNA/RNA non-specific endonuclease [Pontibacter arcticus]